MSNRRLSTNEREELKKMALKGLPPVEIAKYFGMSISSVHNVKKQLKDEGVEFPAVLGRRPSTSEHTPANAKDPKLNATIKNTNRDSQGDLKLVVNGVNVQVGPEAKNVVVANGVVKIDF